jgi:hypothetical protein
VQDLFSLSEDATLIWVGYHPVWLIWGDERLRLDLKRHYVTGESLGLEDYRIDGHLCRVDDARAPDDVMECMALAELDDEPAVARAVAEAVDRHFGQRMLFRFKRQNTPGRRWARWMIRRRMISPSDHADRLDAACQQLVGFGAATPDPAEPAPVAKARIEAIYRAALHRPELAPIATEVLTAYAVGQGFPPRRLAAERLGRLPNTLCRERLLSLMRHENPLVRENAAFAVPRKKPIADRHDLNDELFAMLQDAETPVAAQAMTTLVDIIAGGTRMARFRDFASQVAADPAHRLHGELREAVAWSSDHHRARPGFHRRVGVPKVASVE